MLTMNVELWPFGDEEEAKRLVTINLANMGYSSHDYEKCDYVWTIDEPKPLFGDPIKADGVIFGYDRKASCVNIIAEILQNYKNKNFTREDTPQRFKDTIQRLREKTNPTSNRWPY